MLVDASRYMRGAVLGRLRQASYGGYTAWRRSRRRAAGLADGEELSALAYAKSPVVKALVAPAPTSDVVFWTQGFGAGAASTATAMPRACGAISRASSPASIRASAERSRRHRGRLHRVAQQS